MEKQLVLNDTADREFLVSRLLKAPKELVWEVFTNPAHIKHWWGPEGFTNTIEKMEVRPGGAWKFVMHGPDGTDYPNENLFLEIVEYEKIVFEHVCWPHFITTMTLTPESASTTLLTWHMVFDSQEDFQKAIKTYKADQGLLENLLRLERYLAGAKN